MSGSKRRSLVQWAGPHLLSRVLFRRPDQRSPQVRRRRRGNSRRHRTLRRVPQRDRRHVLRGRRGRGLRSMPVAHGVQPRARRDARTPLARGEIRRRGSGRQRRGLLRSARRHRPRGERRAHPHRLRRWEGSAQRRTRASRAVLSMARARADLPGDGGDVRALRPQGLGRLGRRSAAAPRDRRADPRGDRPRPHPDHDRTCTRPGVAHESARRDQAGWSLPRPRELGSDPN